MKLNNDCVRDLLLYLEENLTLIDSLIVGDIKLKDYSAEELLYTANRLLEANFLNGSKRIYDNTDLFIMISSITYQGHQFLDSIRDKDVWSETKAKASKIASVSLPILQELAATAIKVKLGLS